MMFWPIYWQSAADFFAMGGYGLYVWGSFGACALLMAAEPVMVQMRTRAAYRTITIERIAEQLDKDTATS